MGLCMGSPGSYEVTDKARQTCETGSSATEQRDNSLVRCSVPGETGDSQLGNGEPGE